MNKRLVLIALAIVIPVALAILLAQFSLPEMLQAQDQKTIAIDDAPARSIPLTLDEARSMASERVEHLKTLSQREWNQERKLIPHKFPPETIGAAISRAELRVVDLSTMSEEGWAIEREKLVAREKARLPSTEWSEN